MQFHNRQLKGFKHRVNPNKIVNQLRFSSVCESGAFINDVSRKNIGSCVLKNIKQQMSSE